MFKVPVIFPFEVFILRPFGNAPEEIENVKVSDSTSEAPQAIVPTFAPSIKLPNEPALTENVGDEFTCNPSPREADRPETFVTLTL